MIKMASTVSAGRGHSYVYVPCLDAIVIDREFFEQVWANFRVQLCISAILLLPNNMYFFWSVYQVFGFESSAGSLSLMSSSRMLQLSIEPPMLTHCIAMIQ